MRAVSEAAENLSPPDAARVKAALERALADGTLAFGEDAADLAFVRYALASRALADASFDEALRHATALTRIVAAAEQAGVSVEPDAERSAALLASILEKSQAEPSAVEEALHDWARAARARGDARATGHAENQLALALARRGARDEARPHFDHALEHRRKALGKNAIETLETLYNRSTFRDQSLALEQVAADLEAVVSGLAGCDGARERELSESALHNLGVLREEQGDAVKAAELYGQALAQREERLGQKHVALRPTLVRLAQLNHREGRLVHALALYERALALARSELPETHPMVVALEAWRAELTQGVGPLALKRN